MNIAEVAGALWWIIPTIVVALMAISVVVVRADPIFGVAAPYMNAFDAWSLAMYRRQTRLNGDQSANYFKPPKNAPLATTVISQIVAASAMVVFIAGKYIYNKNKKPVAGTNDVLQAINEGKEETAKVQEKVGEVQEALSITTASTVNQEVKTWRDELMQKREEYAAKVDECPDATLDECIAGIREEYNAWTEGHLAEARDSGLTERAQRYAEEIEDADAFDFAF